MSEKANEEKILKNKYYIGQEVYFIDETGKPQVDTISDIKIEAVDELCYGLDWLGSYLNESELFLTEKDAVKAYKKRQIEECKRNIEIYTEDLNRVLAELKALEEEDEK